MLNSMGVMIFLFLAIFIIPGNSKREVRDKNHLAFLCGRVSELAFYGNKSLPASAPL